MTKTLSILAVLVLSLSTVFAAPPKDEISIAMNAEFDTINPIVNTMMAGVMIDDAVIRPVTKLTPAGHPEPVLIKEIPSLENKKLK
ncbi:MAG: hypothetical protein ACM3MG_01570, partial [Bacillota bacterium]